MEQVPYCKECGQHEEFIVIDEHLFVCICGYQFSCISISVKKSTMTSPSPSPPFDYQVH